MTSIFVFAGRRPQHVARHHRGHRTGLLEVRGPGQRERSPVGATHPGVAALHFHRVLQRRADVGEVVGERLHYCVALVDRVWAGLMPRAVRRDDHFTCPERRRDRRPTHPRVMRIGNRCRDDPDFIEISPSGLGDHLELDRLALERLHHHGYEGDDRKRIGLQERNDTRDDVPLIDGSVALVEHLESDCVLQAAPNGRERFVSTGQGAAYLGVAVVWMPDSTRRVEVCRASDKAKGAGRPGEPMWVRRRKLPR